MTLRLALSLSAVFALTACNPVANLNAGEDKIAEFQEAYSSGEFKRVWALTGTEFRSVSDEDEFGEVYEVIRTRLGPVADSERSGFNVNTNNGRTVTVVTMQTDFELGAGLETYTFVGHSEDMELAGWSVNSDRLVITSDMISGDAAAAEEPEAVE